MERVVEFHHLFHLKTSEAREGTDAFLQNAFQLGALIMSSGVFPIVAYMGVDLNNIIVRQENVGGMNLRVPTPVNNACRQRVISICTAMVANVP